MEPLPPAPDNPFAHPQGHSPPKELDYELIRHIGHGGYGDVWLVRDRTGKFFACKVIYRETFQHDRPYEREFDGIRKFEPVSRGNESQVKILHVGRRDAAGYFYYIMELADDAVTGPEIDPESYAPKTLHGEMQRHGRLPVKECIHIGISLAAALENLHSHGLIHRDVKPANIIFVKGIPKLADIGLVTDLDVSISYVGTEGFIPPEGPRSRQADIYGLGKVLYEISMGKDRLEFPELPENLAELADRELLLELNAVIVKACESDTRKRYASAREMQDDLLLLESGTSVRQRQQGKRNFAFLVRVVFTLAIVALLAFGVATIYKHWSNGANPVAPSTPTRIPMPDATQVAAAEARIRQSYREQLSRGARSSVREEAATELLNRSANAPDPASEFASLRVAALLAAETDDLTLAMGICDRMQQRFETSISPFKAELLSTVASRARAARNDSDLAESCLNAGFEAFAADEYPAATKLADLARTAAQTANSASLQHESGFLTTEVARCRDAYAALRNVADTLRRNPADPVANVAMGKFLCFVKEDWDAGLPLLARGGDLSLKRIAGEELDSKLKTVENQIALGNLWWDWSSNTPPSAAASARRARYWYLKAIAGSKGADKTNRQEQLAARINAVRTEPAEVHISSLISGSSAVDIYSDVVLWHSNRTATDNKVNHVRVGDIESNGLRIIKNSGASRYLPDAVDFSHAQLVVNHAKGQGQAHLQIADDHVRVSLYHPRLSANDIDVSVVFGGSP